MKINYDRESDILTIALEPGGQIEHAEQTDNVIIYFSPDNKPILLEILKANDFLAEALRAQQAGLRPSDSPLVQRAVAVQDSISRLSPGTGEDSTAEIRRWRETR